MSSQREAILRAQSSAILLEILPRFLAKLAIQSPLLQSTAQHPTFTSLLRIPIIDPSVLSFTQPGMVFFQLTWTWILLGLLELSGKITKNPAPFLIQWECIFGSVLPNWKINRFQWRQIIHIAWGKENLPRYTRLQEKLMRFTVPF